ELLVINDIMVLDDTVFTDNNDTNNETDEISDEAQNNYLDYNPKDLVSTILEEENYDLENENNNLLNIRDGNIEFESINDLQRKIMMMIMVVLKTDLIMI